MNQKQNPNVTNVQTSLFCNNSYQRTSFNYNGASVEFRLTENVMLNAAQMAKHFGKKPKDWLRLASSKQFLFALQKSNAEKHAFDSKSKRLISPLDSKASRENPTLNVNENGKQQINSTYHSYYGGLVIGQHGGANPGTWMHEDVAIEFARWLNPKFAIWCNDRIKEILRDGKPLAPVAKAVKAPKVVKALPEQILIEGMPVEEYFKLRTALINDRIHSYRTKMSNEQDVNFFVVSDLMNFTWFDTMSVSENLKNMVAIMNNNTLTAWFLLYKSIGAEKREAEMKQTIQSLVDHSFKKHKIYPNR